MRNRVAVIAGLAATVAAVASSAKPLPDPARRPGRSPPSDPPAAPALHDHADYPDLASVMRALVPVDTRVVGFGELHNRTDRAAVRSALAVFTADALPALAQRLSDLVVETWIVDPKCGQQAKQVTKQIETDVKRPEATKSEIALLADAARAAKIQPQAMTLTCADYARLNAPPPAGGSGSAAPPPGFDAEAMLTLTTRELTRITVSTIVHRDREPAHRPLIAVYGGALHNDRFPVDGTADWSYAAAVDKATHDRYVEIDLIVPELAAQDAASAKQAWFPLVAAARDRVQVWTRGERSYVVVLPRAQAATPAPTP